jgi:hypothetical protein
MHDVLCCAVLYVLWPQDVMGASWMDHILLSSAREDDMAELMAEGVAVMEATHLQRSCMGEYVVTQPYDLVSNVMNAALAKKWYSAWLQRFMTEGRCSQSSVQEPCYSVLQRNIGTLEVAFTYDNL